jgi:hypothetical protein
MEGSQSQTTSPDEAGRGGFLARIRSRPAYPVGLLVVAWGGVGLFVAAALVGEVALNFVLWGAGAVVTFGVWRLSGASGMKHTDTASPEEDGCGRVAWLVVACVPAALVAAAMGSALRYTPKQHSWGDWVWVFGAVGYLALAIFVCAPLLTSRGRRALFRPNGRPGLSGLVTAVGTIHLGTNDTVVERRRRRETIEVVELLLWTIAYAIGGFAVLLAFLTIHKYGDVHLTPPTSSRLRDVRAADAYVLWQSLNLVPFLDIPKTLHWSLHRTFTDPRSGAILLTLKLFIVLPVVKTVVDLSRGERL